MSSSQASEVLPRDREQGPRVWSPVSEAEQGLLLNQALAPVAGISEEQSHFGLHEIAAPGQRAQGPQVPGCPLVLLVARQGPLPCKGEGERPVSTTVLRGVMEGGWLQQDNGLCVLWPLKNLQSIKPLLRTQC